MAKRIMVPFENKDQAVNLGAKWNHVAKEWYIPDNIDDISRIDELLKLYDFVYLAVPFAEKNDAKDLGAKWDSNKKKWYSLKSNPNLSKLEKYFEDDTPITLVGESKEFDYINLTPRPCYITNAKYFVSLKDWMRIEKHVTERANGTCESCKYKTTNLYVLDLYEFDSENYVQILTGFMALCKACFQLSSLHKEGANLEHLMLVSEMLEDEAKEYISFKKELRVTMSNETWDLDLSLLESNGIHINKILSAKERNALVNNTFIK